MAKKMLSIEDINGQTAFALPAREMMAVAVGNALGAGGLIGVGANVQAPIDVNVEDNEICVGVAAVVAAAGCQQ